MHESGFASFSLSEVRKVHENTISLCSCNLHQKPYVNKQNNASKKNKKRKINAQLRLLLCAIFTFIVFNWLPAELLEAET